MDQSSFSFVVKYTVIRAIYVISGINVYCGKVVTIVKNYIPNAGNTVRHGYTDKVGTIVKSFIHNAGKGTAGKVKRNVFAPVGMQRASGAS